MIWPLKTYRSKVPAQQRSYYFPSLSECSGVIAERVKHSMVVVTEYSELMYFHNIFKCVCFSCQVILNQKKSFRQMVVVDYSSEYVCFRTSLAQLALTECTTVHCFLFGEKWYGTHCIIFDTTTNWIFNIKQLYWMWYALTRSIL